MVIHLVEAKTKHLSCFFAPSVFIAKYELNNLVDKAITRQLTAETAEDTVQNDSAGPGYPFGLELRPT